MRAELDVVFLTGGYGSRMGDIAEERQKCVLPYEGKPVVGYSLDAASEAFGKNFRPIMAVGHRDTDVRDTFKDFWHGKKIEYVPHTPGTEDRGVLHSVRDVLSGGLFLVVHGNIIFDSNVLPALVERHEQKNSMTTITVADKVDESMHDIVVLGGPDGSDVEEILIPQPDANTLKLFQENNFEIDVYPIDKDTQEMKEEGYRREMGINVYDGRIYNLLEGYTNPATPHMIWIYTDHLNKGGKVSGVVYSGDWLHIQTPEDLQRKRIRG